MEQFTIIWMWGPLVAAIYLAAPWILWQIWAFIAPGLYPRERRWAGPFILVTVGLFVAGGAFAYYIALPFALTFLLGLGESAGVKASISIDSYFSLFVNAVLGVSVLFELPIVVFFLTLLRITTPGFLIRNSRYAILAIVILAAVVTPTPDPVNLALFSIPMILLFFLGVFASYLLVLHREGQRFPWKAFFIWIGSIVALLGAVVAGAVFYYGFKLVPYWPFLTQ
jgi:sec-independent protein translocase protein TatC